MPMTFPHRAPHLVIALVFVLAAATAGAVPAARAASPISTGGDSTAIVPIDWSRFGDEALVDPADRRLLTWALTASRYTLRTWYPQRYGSQTGEYLDFGGTNAVAIRNPAMAAVGTAVPLAIDAYDEEAVGLPEAEARARLAMVTSSLAYRHRANLGPDGWGSVDLRREWNWEPPYWASLAALAAWLLWDDLSEQDRTNVQRMMEHEVSNILVVPSRYMRDSAGRLLRPGDTQAEENAVWASALGVATAMMPNHPLWPEWHNDFLARSIAAYARPSDTRSSEEVNGRLLATFLEGSNLEENGTAVNHGFLHPIYMISWTESVNTALAAALGGQHIPEGVFHNTDVVYDALVDLPFTSPPSRRPGGTIYRNGSAEIYYPEGNDWGTRFPAYFAQVDVLADRLGLDTLVAEKASAWEQLHVGDAVGMQQRFPDGHSYANNQESSFGGKEERVAQIAGLSLLTAWLKEQESLCLTRRSYTSAEPDAVLGELEQAAPFGENTRRLVTEYQSRGILSQGKAKYIRETVDRIESRAVAVATARRAGDDNAIRSGTAMALQAATQLDRWLAEQMTSAALSAHAGANLRAQAYPVRRDLSTLSGCLDRVSARLLAEGVSVTPGTTFEVTAVLDNTSGEEPLSEASVSLDLPDEWTARPLDQTSIETVPAGAQHTVRHRVSVPKTTQVAEGTQLTGEASYVTRGGLVTLPLQARLRPTPLPTPTIGTAMTSGELVPVTVTNPGWNRATNVTVSLQLPDGWATSPDVANMGAVDPGRSATASFRITPPDRDGQVRDEPFTEVPATAIASFTLDDVDGLTNTRSATLLVGQPVTPPYQTFASTEAYFGQSGSRTTIYAGGRDMWATHRLDEFGAVYLEDTATDATTATVKIRSQTDTWEWARAGIMMRNDIPGRSGGYVAAAVTPGHGYALMWDSNADGYLDKVSTAAVVSFPSWLRLSRSGSTYTASYSTNGDTWHQIATATVPGVAADQDVGVFASAINLQRPGTIGKVEFEGLTTKTS